MVAVIAAIMPAAIATAPAAPAAATASLRGVCC